MRVLTWNLWWRFGPWQRRREAIASILAEQAPDVCGFQEVWGNRDENLAADLADRLGMYWCWARLPTPPGWQAEHGDSWALGNAVLSRWPITTRAECPLPTDDARERRVIAIHALIDAPGGELPFFTTHLSYQLGGSAQRSKQVRELAGFVAAHTSGRPYPPVVTGDLNAGPESDEFRQLGGVDTAPAAPGLVLFDAWRFADPADPGHTWSRRNGYLTHSGLPDSRIDHILVGPPPGEHGRILSARLAGTAPVDGVWPSDHFAVVAELS